MRLPAELSQKIQEHVQEHHPGSLARAAEELSERYRSDAGRRNALTSDLERAAYLVTRLPATYAAVRAVLEETQKRTPGTEIRSLLDLGSGPGTAAWAAAEIFPRLEQVTLLERDPEFIRVGGQLAAASPHSAIRGARWIQADLAGVGDLPAHDLVVLLYALGELSAQEKLLKTAWAAARVALVIVEPGTSRGFRTVLNARTQLLGAAAHLAAPCPHESECPMARGNDWCHFAQRLERSQLHRRAKSASMGYEDEKFSYIVAAKAEAMRVAARVIRHPVQHKGHIRLELCTPEGLKQQVVTKRDREAFRRARKADWGAEWEP